MVKTFYNLNRQEERNDHHAMNAKTFDDAMKYISYIYLINATKKIVHGVTKKNIE